MKNQIKFKSILPLSLCITGSLLLTLSCSQNKTSDTKLVDYKTNNKLLASNDENILVLENNNDAVFLRNAAEMQLEEIKLGKLAQQKGSSSHIKDLGKMMEKDHTKSLNELKTLAKSKSITIPNTVTKESKDAYEKLDKKSGKDFDKSYSKMMVDHHENAIKLFKKASTETEDSEIRIWATNQLPGLKNHLKHAEECKKKCDKD
jgi:putative membrane protein